MKDGKQLVKTHALTENHLPAGAVVSVSDVLHYIAQDGYLSKRAAANFVGLSIRILEHHKELARYRVGKKILYRKSELIDWMQDHRIPGEPRAASSRAARGILLDELRRQALEMTNNDELKGPSRERRPQGDPGQAGDTVKEALMIDAGKRCTKRRSADLKALNRKGDELPETYQRKKRA